MRALQYLRSPSRIWAIEEGAWEEMVGIASGENLTIEAIEASVGKLDNKTANRVEVVDGVAIIPVIGPIVKYGNLFSSISGATSVTKLTSDFNAALADESVKAIMFDIDSPGGEANGINEFAEQIYQARGTKPIQAYISGQGCSAAYWIASACDPNGVFLNETAVAGSIGVAAVVKDEEGKDEKEGIKTYKFVSEGSENKRPDLQTDEGREVVMESLNALAHVFRGKVARNRSNDQTSLTIRDVIDKFNRGGVLMGESAVKAGLADGTSSRNEVLQNLISKSTENVNTTEKQTVLVGLQENIMEENILELTEQVNTLTAERDTLATQVAHLADVEAALAAAESQLTEAQSQLSALATQSAAAQDENLVLKATAKAAELSDRMVPAQKESFIKGYVMAAKDDKASPIEGTSRLDTFLAMFESAEAHSFTEEELDPETTDLSNDNGEEVDAIAELLKEAKLHAAKVNATASN